MGDSIPDLYAKNSKQQNISSIVTQEYIDGMGKPLKFDALGYIKSKGPGRFVLDSESALYTKQQYH